MTHDEKINNLVNELIEMKKNYYNDSDPNVIKNDEIFDSKERELYLLDPNNEYFTLVGVIPNIDAKIKHNIPMLSLQKANSLAEINKFFIRLNINESFSFLIQPKVDGLSATIKYKNGIVEYISTRGDGYYGRDITHLLKYLNIPTKINLNHEIEVRGELYLPKSYLETFNTDEIKSLRNIASGLVNRKCDHENFLEVKNLRFIAYQLVGLNEILTEYNCISMLMNLGFRTFNSVENVIEMETYNSLADESNYLEVLECFYNSYLSSFKELWEYETDGLVIIINERNMHEKINSKWEVSHHNHYNIALKPPNILKRTKLIDIHWNVSKHGYIIPTGKFKPVEIDNAIIQYATLNNYENVKKMKLHIGDDILVSRRNSVIPCIEENLSVHDKSNFNDDIFVCPSCKSTLIISGVQLRCINVDCDEQKIQRLIHWIKKCDMKNISEQTIRSLYNTNILSTPTDLYDLRHHVEKIQQIQGFGDKKINNLINEIEQSKVMTIDQFIECLGIESVGKKAVQKLNIKTYDDFMKYNDSSYIIGKRLIDFRDSNIEYIQKLIDYVVIIHSIETTNSLNNKRKICMTGKGPKTRTELISLIEKNGDVFVSSITKDLDILLCEDINGNSSKLQKARKLGIKLLSYDNYLI